MKKTAIVFLFLAINGAILCQAPFPTGPEINQFIASRTCVVLENGNSSFNVFIRRAMDEYWKITPYEYINSDDFKNKKSDPSFSFILLTETNFERDKSKTSYYFINLLQGKNVQSISQMPEICAIPLSFAGEDDLEYGYKLGAILSFMQKHAEMISNDPSLTGRRYLRYYNKNIPLLTGKTILVKQEDLSPAINTIEKINAIYKNRVEIVPEETIMKAIKDKAAGMVILHKVGPVGDSVSGYCFKMLISTDDSEMYYYNQHLIDKANPNGLLPADLKRLGRF